MSGPELGARAALHAELPSPRRDWHTARPAMAERNALNTRCAAWAAGCLLTVLAGCAALPTRPNAELFEGNAAISGYQQETWLYDRVVITENGKEALSARLRIIDRGANLAGRLGGEDVSGKCTTFNGFTLDLDCKLFRRADGAPVAYLRVPLH